MFRIGLFLSLIRRDIRERYLSTFAGIAWVFLTPLALLAVYGFVFLSLLGVRFGDRVGGDVLAFLALGMWPWYLFAESLSRGTTAFQQNAGWMNQISIPRLGVVLVPVVGTALVQVAAFATVVTGLLIAGSATPSLALLQLPLLLAMIVVFSASLALILSLANVYFRDVGTVLPQVLTLWMLVTPVFYDPSSLPVETANRLSINPMAQWIIGIRSVLAGEWLEVTWIGWWTLALFAMCALCLWFFNRQARRIEDFL